LPLFQLQTPLKNTTTKQLPINFCVNNKVKCMEFEQNFEHDLKHFISFLKRRSKQSWKFQKRCFTLIILVPKSNRTCTLQKIMPECGEKCCIIEHFDNFWYIVWFSTSPIWLKQPFTLIFTPIQSDCVVREATNYYYDF